MVLVMELIMCTVQVRRRMAPKTARKKRNIEVVAKPAVKKRYCPTGPISRCAPQLFFTVMDNINSRITRHQREERGVEIE